MESAAIGKICGILLAYKGDIPGIKITAEQAIAEISDVVMWYLSGINEEVKSIEMGSRQKLQDYTAV